MKIKQIKSLVVFGALLLWVTPVLAFNSGEAAPDFELSNADGANIGLHELKGKAFLLKLGTSWCPGCGQQTRELKDLEEFLDSREVPVVEVFLQDTWEDVGAFFANLGMEIPELALMDDGSVRKAYQVYVIPRLLLVDREGIIRFDQKLVPGSEIRKEIEHLFEEGHTQGENL